MSTVKSLLVAVVAASFLVVGPAATGQDNGASGAGDGPIPVGGGWQYISWWGGDGTPIDQNPLTFTATGLVTLKVTDAFCYGDQFSVEDNGQYVGDTSAPGSNACGGPSSPDAAYADPDMSSGCFLMLPGTHSVELTAILSPFGAGGGYARADNVGADVAGLLACLQLPI